MTQAPLSGSAAAAVGLAAFGVVVTDAGWQVVRHGAVMAHEGLTLWRIRCWAAKSTT